MRTNIASAGTRVKRQKRHISWQRKKATKAGSAFGDMTIQERERIGDKRIRLGITAKEAKKRYETNYSLDSARQLLELEKRRLKLELKYLKRRGRIKEHDWDFYGKRIEYLKKKIRQIRRTLDKIERNKTKENSRQVNEIHMEIRKIFKET
jgi:hypothetical protein